MEQKLAEHRELIEHRLDTQDAKLEAMQEDLTSLVGTEKVPGLVMQNTDLLQGLVDKHESWHEQDNQFRSAITQQVAKLAEQHIDIAKDVRQVRWFIKACYALGKAGKTTVAVVREGKDLYKAVAAGGISWLVIVQFMHVVWPVIISFIHSHR
jgi:predicted nuclease with TOPRIM domain